MNAAPRTFGVTNDTPPPVDPALATALEELDRCGFTVLRNQLGAETLATMRDALDRVLASQTERFGGTAALDAINDAGVARALLREDPIFLELVRLPALDALLEAVLGPAAIVLQQNGIVVPPLAGDHHQHSWHRDLPYQSWVCTKPIALGTLCALDEFTAENGATRFLTGSQRYEKFPSAEYLSRWGHRAIAPAGSVVVFDAMCFHSAGINRSPNPRRAVNTLFGIPLLSQQIAFAPEPGMDAKLRRRLGLDYQPAASVDAWRDARRRRLAGTGA